MKLLFYSDLHIRPERIETCDFVLGEIGKLAKKHGAIIVNGGDTFNTRGLIKTSCFDLLYRHYTKWFDMGLKQVINVGNHDQEDLAGEIHPMKVFENFEGWKVADKPTHFGEVNDTIAIFPYMPRKDMQAEIEKKALLSKYAVVHWGIRGAKRNDWNVDTDGVPVEWLKPFRKVFSGHYHLRSEFENVQYIGSPFQQNFAEIGQDKGVILFDTMTRKSEFIEIKGTPQHHKIEFDANEKKFIYSGEIEDGDIVEVAVTGDAEKVKFVSVDSVLNILDKQCKVTLDRQGKEKAFSRLKIEPTEILDQKSLMKKYVDFIDTDLDRKRLMEIGETIVQR